MEFRLNTRNKEQFNLKKGTKILDLNSPNADFQPVIRWSLRGTEVQ